MKILSTKFRLTSSIILLIFMTFQSQSQVFVISPNGGETWVNNTVDTLKFNNLGLAEYFDIQFSPDNGQNYYSLEFVYADYGLNIVLLDVFYQQTNEAKIKVVSYSYPLVFDESNAPFSVVNPSLLILKPEYLEFNYQNLPIEVSWLRNDPSTVVDVSLSLDNGQSWSVVGEDVDDTEYSFIAPPQSSSNAFVKITNVADPEDFTVSKQFYIFAEPFIAIVTPNGGEVWDWSEETATIEWAGSELLSYMNFFFSSDGGANYTYLTSAYSSQTGGSTEVSIPFVNTDNAKIKIIDPYGNEDESDLPFTVYIPPVIIYYPRPDYIYYAGSDLTISWWANELDFVKIELSLDNGQSFSPIAENITATQQIYYYPIPQTSFSEQCIVRVSNQNDPSQFDLSEVFEILPRPTITVITPNGGEMWEPNTQYQIEWTYDNMVYDYTNIWAEFSPDNGLTWQYLGWVGQYGQVGTLLWISPSVESDECLFRITDAYLSDVIDISDAPFSVRNIPNVPICMVSVDQSSSKNIVVWEPVQSDLIDEYVIYKETNQSNVYQEIGFVAQNSATVFVDLNSNPMVQASRYKLGFRDSEGAEYQQSDFHQTIHLTISPGVGNAWNLIWSPYLGFVVQSYNIYRGYSPGEMELITTISGSFNSFTDFGATGGSVYYMVEVVSPNPCSPQNLLNGVTVFGSTTSNIASNVVTSISDNNGNQNITVYPVPASQWVTVKLNGSIRGKTEIEVLNQLGQVVKTSEIFVDTMFSEYRIDVSDLQNGMYILAVRNNDNSNTTRFIINR